MVGFGQKKRKEGFSVLSVLMMFMHVKGCKSRILGLIGRG